MSTNDVPGAKAANNDELAMGCWAEHEDGSLILVESTEGNRIIYSIFNMSEDPPWEYRDAMPQDGFMDHYSFDGKPDSIKWTWHDKTPFPWDRIIKEGIKDGTKFACADHLLTAAEKIKKDRELKGSPFKPDDAKQRMDRLGRAGMIIVDAIQRAIGTLAPGDDKS
jgi:hypothetical protein